MSPVSLASAGDSGGDTAFTAGDFGEWSSIVLRPGPFDRFFDDRGEWGAMGCFSSARGDAAPAKAPAKAPANAPANASFLPCSGVDRWKWPHAPLAGSTAHRR